MSDGRRFFARQQPRLYDVANRRIPPEEIPSGSTVNVNVHDAWMNAVQIVTAVDDSPFLSLDG